MNSLNSLENLIGQQFAWFTGVVEDVDDPEQMGRVRVRCIGYHSENRVDIPTSSLPWAVVMTPIQSASMSGIGQSATGILPGSWVIGFFRDGRSAQDPIVMGSVPSYSTKSDQSVGFSDPSGKYPLKNGIDTPVEATSNFTASELLQKRESITEATVKLASVPAMSAGSANASPEQTWSPKSRYDVVSPKYPKNQVFRSESGHIKEVDDTPSAERTLDMHKTGTYVEVDASGDKTTVVTGDNYEVMIKDNNVYIKGECNLTVDGNLRTYVKGNYLLEVDGDKFEYIKGSRFSSVAKYDQMDSKQAVIAVDSTATLALKSKLSSLDGLSGIEFIHPQIDAIGNFAVTIAPSTNFTTTDGKNITVARGIVTNVSS
jgi:hypothetical protein